MWLAVVLGSLTALAPLSIDMYLPSLPSLARELHVSTSFAQLSLTFCLVGLALGQLLAGPLSDALGRRRPLIAGLVVYTAASFLCATTSSIWILIALRLIQGLAGSAGIVIARAVARDYFSGSELTTFFARLMLVNGAAPILAPVAGGQLLRVTTWHGVFVVLGALGVLMVLAVVFGLPESLPSHKRSKGGLRNTLITLSKLVRHRTFLGYSLAQALVFAAMFGYISGSPFVLQEIFGVSPQTFSVIFAVNGLGIILASQLSARFSTRIGEAKVLVVGLGLAALSSVVLFSMIWLGVGLFAVLPPLFLVVACVGIVGTTSTSLAMQSQGRSAGTAAALIGVVQMLMGAVATPLVGTGGSRTSMPMGVVIAVCDMCAILCYFLLVHRSGHLGAQENSLTSR
jgi:MFS transporter, DHA1 family, multidrug resistance protein